MYVINSLVWVEQKDIKLFWILMISCNLQCIMILTVWESARLMDKLYNRYGDNRLRIWIRLAVVTSAGKLWVFLLSSPWLTRKASARDKVCELLFSRLGRYRFRVEKIFPARRLFRSISIEFPGIHSLFLSSPANERTYERPNVTNFIILLTIRAKSVCVWIRSFVRCLNNS